MRRQIEEMQDTLAHLERAMDNLVQKDKNFSSVDAKDILYALKSIAGNLSDTFDTLEFQTDDLNNRWGGHEADIQRVNERTITMIGDIRELRETQERLEEKLDRLSDAILRNLKHIEVKGAEEDG